MKFYSRPKNSNPKDCIKSIIVIYPTTLFSTHFILIILSDSAYHHHHTLHSLTKYIKHIFFYGTCFRCINMATVKYQYSSLSRATCEKSSGLMSADIVISLESA